MQQRQPSNGNMDWEGNTGYDLREHHIDAGKLSKK